MGDVGCCLDVWERQQLCKRDRSLVSVSAFNAMNRPDQLRSHLVRARENGLTEAELVQAITHLAFYAGWPNAVTAVSVSKGRIQEELIDAVALRRRRRDIT
jgi:4-carboxymuconolactone decarboxylase